MDDASNNLVGTLTQVDVYNYPNVRRHVEIASVSPVGSTEAERAASGIRRSKTAYRSIMTIEREGNLNLIQLLSLVEVDVWKVADIFMRNGNRGMMQTSK